MEPGDRMGWIPTIALSGRTARRPGPAPPAVGPGRDRPRFVRRVRRMRPTQCRAACVRWCHMEWHHSDTRSCRAPQACRCRRGQRARSRPSHGWGCRAHRKRSSHRPCSYTRGGASPRLRAMVALTTGGRNRQQRRTTSPPRIAKPTGGGQEGDRAARRDHAPFAVHPSFFPPPTM